MSTSTDYVYRAAEKARTRAMDKDDLRHILSEGVAWAVVTIISAATFALAVLESAK